MAYDDMRGGWKWLTGDMSWEDYGGQWVKRIGKTYRYVVLRFENGKEHDHELPRYMCDAVSVDVSALLEDGRVEDVLKTCGMRLVYEENDCRIYSDSGDEIASLENDEERFRLILVETAVSHGAHAPLGCSASADSYPLRVRAVSRRAADELIRHEEKLEAALNRPVNQVGSTALEYERGDLCSALHRGEDDPRKALLRRIMCC